MEAYFGITWPPHLTYLHATCSGSNTIFALEDLIKYNSLSFRNLVNFLKASPEAANLYHDVSFKYSNDVSHEALYARFAWALIKIIKDMALNPKRFNFQKPGHNEKGEGGSGGGGQNTGRARKRKCGPETEIETEMKMEVEVEKEKIMGPIVQANQLSDTRNLHYWDAFLKSLQMIAGL